MTVLAPVLAAVALAASPAPGPGSTYLAAGDSMTAPAAPGPTYPVTVAAELRERQPRLRMRRTGCGGMTAQEMVRGGGPCTYPEGTQLRAAEADLRARRGRVDLVTVTIGGNDVFECAAAADTACLRERLPGVIANVRTIARRLRAAAGRGATVIGTTYHDPFLGYWVQDREADARASVPVVEEFNRALAAAYRAEGYRVADIGANFRISDFSEGAAGLPANVATTCRLTRACPRDPLAFDVHPNRAGYERIGRLVVRVRAGAKR